jgi:hypothetical protein
MENTSQQSLRWLLASICILTSVVALAQSPDRISYQAVLRNPSGNVVANQSVAMRISILKGTATGAAVYTETHQGVTGSTGMLSIVIGGGSMVSGSMESIDWSQGPFFLKVESDLTGGSNYVTFTTSQFLSVPFSLYSKNVYSKSSGDTLFIGNKKYVISGLKSADNNGLQVGDAYGGGVVAYIYQPGDPGYDPNVPHGLISSKIDQTINATSGYYSGTGCMWQQGTYVAAQQTTIFDTTNSKGTLMGTGKTNTAKIMEVSRRTGRPFAAAQYAIACRDGGFTDWILPSNDELMKLYMNRNKIGGFFAGWYWSSTEINDAYAGALDFSNGSLSEGYKGPGGTPYKVRAIRYF